MEFIAKGKPFEKEKLEFCCYKLNVNSPVLNLKKVDIRASNKLLKIQYQDFNQSEDNKKLLNSANIKLRFEVLK